MDVTFERIAFTSDYERQLSVSRRLANTLAVTLLPLLAVAAFFAWIGLGGSSARLLIPLPEPIRAPDTFTRNQLTFHRP